MLSDLSGEIQIVNGYQWISMDINGWISCGSLLDSQPTSLLRSARDLSIASFDVEASCSSADADGFVGFVVCGLGASKLVQNVDLNVDLTVLENMI